MRILKYLGFLIFAWVLIGCQQKTEPETLTVSAKVTMKIPADTAELDLDIYASAPTRKAAVEQIVKEHNLVKADLPQIDGIKNIEFEADEIVIR